MSAKWAGDQPWSRSVTLESYQQGGDGSSRGDDGSKFIATSDQFGTIVPLPPAPSAFPGLRSSVEPGAWAERLRLGFLGRELGLIDRGIGILGDIWLGLVDCQEHLLASLARAMLQPTQRFSSTPPWISGEVG
jgi:hypothetical protein